MGECECFEHCGAVDYWYYFKKCITIAARDSEEVFNMLEELSRD